jgi:adenine-specific DNA-methyltransferase
LASFDIKRAELIWPGKYDGRGQRVTPPRVSLPFQTIETINESRATREAHKRPEQTTLFDVWTGDEGETFEEGWRNKLIWGNNQLVMSSLLEKFAGKIDLIYIDPPFATGADFSVNARIGEGDFVMKEQSMIEEKAYRDTWGRGIDSYLGMMADRLTLIRDLLAPSGNLFVHLDWHVGHYLKVVLDEIFGVGDFLGEIVWNYGSPSGGRVSGSKLVKAHDTIYHWAKSRGDHKYELVYLPYSEKYINDWFKNVDEDGRRYQRRQRGRDASGTAVWEKQYLDESKGVPASSVWNDIQQVYADPRAYKEGTSSELLDYPTQKPERLIERVLQMASDPGDLVADFFVGSGTTAAVAERLGRRWIACDLGRFSVHTTRKRLMSIEGCRPFEVLNLGRYERQYWQSASFGGRDEDRVLFEYIAFLLRLYRAEPLPGLQHIHGKRDSAVIHIGAVDAPVTISEVTDALDECVAAGQRELHVLGWEWEMGLNDLVDQLAQERRVRLKLLAIPREVMEAQAVDQGDIRFFELAHLECGLEPGQNCSLVVELTNFAMSDADAIDDDLRAKITKWSDFVDYWAIDFDFQNDTFMNGWVAYRTRKDRRLTLRSDSHRYPEAGTYRVAIKVVDIFGNDTTKVFSVEVK